ncbi:MAG: nucleotidyltransferase domain-containing protein [Sulfolobales archaeon]
MHRFRYYRLGSEEKSRVIEKLRDTLVDKGVKLAILFGSFIEADSFRDIDIAVYLEDFENLDRILKLGVKLEEALNLPIDIVPLQALSPRFRLWVLTKGMVLVEEPGLYEAMLSQTIDELILMNMDASKR